MPQINFTPEGLEAAWPSMRWLEFLDGPSRGPVLGVELGYSGPTATLYVGTYLRSRFDAAMALAEDDPVQELATSVAQQMINRILYQTDAAGPIRSTLIKVLLSYSTERAAELDDWDRSVWHVATVDSARQETEARITSLAGWQGGFAVTDDLYITAHAYGVPIEQIALGPVLDPISYGFTFESAELRSDALTSIPGNIKSEMMHADLARLLEERSGPGLVRPPR